MKKTILYLGADHAGFKLKENVKAELVKSGEMVIDLSPRFREGDDYPLEASKVAEAISANTQAKGLLFCGSGVGMAISANRFKGVRAFDAHNLKEVKLAREHNDTNVMALSGWRLNARQAMDLIRVFLKASASKITRHRRRIKQIDKSLSR